jgi:putative flippase GtrA
MSKISDELSEKSGLPIKLFIVSLFRRYRVLNFMVVGGIGYIINIAIYYPLTLLFQHTVTFLGQQFYLPPYLVSSFAAISSNYYLNKISTFRDCQEKSLGYVKYLTTCSVSLPVEMVFIFFFVQFLHFLPVLAAAAAILVVFLGRYFVISRIVWHNKKA